MITTRYIGVWMMAKKAMGRLKHPVLTSEHLFYACLRLLDQSHWELARNLPVTAETVWSHLRENPPVLEPNEDFSGLKLGISAKAALERADVEAGQHGHPRSGTNGLMRALLAESERSVRSLLDGVKPAAQA